MPAPPLSNTFEGGTDGAAITVGNSGGASGDAFSVVNVGAPKFSKTQARDSLAFQVVDDTTGTQAQWQGLGSFTTDVWLRAYLWISVKPVTHAHQPFGTISSAGADNGFVLVTTGGFMAGELPSGAAVGTGVVAVPLAAWFRAEARFRASTTVGQIEWKWWSDPESTGAPDETVSSTGLVMAANVDRATWGNASTVYPATPFTYYLDNIAVSSTGWIGPVPSLVLPPASGGFQ